MFESLYNSDGLLVSAYLSKPRGQSASATLSDLTRPLRQRGQGMARHLEKNLSRNIERLLDLAPRLDGEMAPGVAIFVNEGEVVYEPLRHPVPDRATLGRRPYLRPMRAIPPVQRTAVAVTDKRRVSLFVKQDGHLTALEAPSEADLGAPRWGGWHGLEEHNRRQHAREATAHMLREAAGRLFEAHQAQPFDMLVLAGHQATIDELTPHLHTYLRQLPLGHFIIDPHTATPAIIRAEAERIETDHHRLDDRHTTEQMLAALDGGADGARGLTEVLAATNARAIKQLVASKSFCPTGARCPDCGFLASEQRACPVCGAHMEPVDDVVGDVIESVLADGGEVRDVDPHPALDSEGVVANTRFPVR